MAQFEVTTLARVKEFCGITTDTTNDSIFSRLVISVSAVIEDYLTRPLLVASRVEDYNVEPFVRMISLRAWPVTAVASLKNDLDRVFGTDTVVQTTDYYVELRTGVIYVDTNLDPGRGVVRIDYTGGMAADTTSFIAAFPDIADWADRQIKYEFDRMKNLGATSTSLPNGSQQFSGEVRMLKGLMDALKSHRPPVVL